MDQTMYPGHLKETLRKDGKRTSPRLRDGLKNYIIDIDGVISEDIPNEERERMAEAYVIPGAVETINSWYDEGHIITFFTSRTEREKDVTILWLENNGFHYHNIIFGKPRGGSYHYIDDCHVQASTFPGKFTKLVKKTKVIEVFESC